MASFCLYIALSEKRGWLWAQGLLSAYFGDVDFRVLERRTIGEENGWVESLFYPFTIAVYIGTS
jgi:hypothetical protein